MTLTLPLRRPRPVPSGARAAHRGDIEGLRAVAVLLVVLAHIGVPGLAGGFVGVDVFFVISGFLITSLLRREFAATGRIDLARFYARRAVRLLPVATLVIAATALHHDGPAGWRYVTKAGEVLEPDGTLRELATICVDSSERGTSRRRCGSPPSPATLWPRPPGR